MKPRFVPHRLLQTVFNNFWLKVISVAFATVLFIIVRTEQVREFSLVGKVRILTADDVMVVGADERAVDLQIKLPHSVFSVPPGEDELTGILDVSEQGPGRIRVRLSRDNFPNLDQRMSVTVLDPWLEVDLDEIVRKRLPIRAVLQGLPKEGLTVARVILNPEDTEVVGAAREVAALQTLSTSPVSIDGIDQNFSAITRVIVPENSGLQLGTSSVNVQVSVEKTTNSRHVRQVTIEVRHPGPFQYTIEPAQISVELQGDNGLIEALTDESVSAFVDGTELVGGSQMVKVWLKLPPGVRLITTDPEKVRVSRRQ